MSMRHLCFDEVDTKLAERNTRLTFPIMVFAPDQIQRPLLQTEQIETGRGKAKAVGMFATHCPFCGEHLGGEA